MANLKNNFIIGQVNVRSLVPAVNDIKALIDQYKFDVLGITETWLDERIDNDSINIDCYEFFRVDRVNGRRGVVLECTAEQGYVQVW